MGRKQVINRILGRYFTNTVTDREKTLLDEWKSDNKENLWEFIDYEFIWRESGKLNGLAENENPIQTLKQAMRPKARYHTYVKYLVQAAAVVLLSLLFTTVFNYLETDSIPLAENTVYQETKAAYGTQTKVMLADGTVVYLNSGSTLRFPISFEGSEIRKVYLDGEGYFDVKSMTDSPFIVDVDALQIKVTGTKFNVNAYKRSGQFYIALIEGSVTLQREQAMSMVEICSLEKGDYAVLNSETQQLNISRHSSLTRYFSWIEGKIVFENDPIHVVVERLSAWYNVDIEIADRQLARYRFTGTFINEPLEQVLMLLSRTSPMSYTLMPSQKLDDNTFSKRQIILRSKS